jgi:hypothetical protein
MQLCYLAGPMTNRPQFNYPLFDHVAEVLKSWPLWGGVEVITPMEGDSPEEQALARSSVNGSVADYQGPSYGTLVSRGIKTVLDRDIAHIVLLPGWQTSKGTRLEVMAALLKGGIEFEEVLSADPGEPMVFRHRTSSQIAVELVCSVLG